MDGRRRRRRRPSLKCRPVTGRHPVDHRREPAGDAGHSAGITQHGSTEQDLPACLHFPPFRADLPCRDLEPCESIIAVLLRFC